MPLSIPRISAKFDTTERPLRQVIARCSLYE
jgi:hypothetical protein